MNDTDPAKDEIYIILSFNYNGLFVSIDFTHLTNIVDKTTKVAVSLTNQLDGDIYSLIFCLFTAPGSDRHNCYT